MEGRKRRKGPKERLLSQNSIWLPGMRELPSLRPLLPLRSCIAFGELNLNATNKAEY